MRPEKTEGRAIEGRRGPREAVAPRRAGGWRCGTPLKPLVRSRLYGLGPQQSNSQGVSLRRRKPRQRIVERVVQQVSQRAEGQLRLCCERYSAHDVPEVENEASREPSEITFYPLTWGSLRRRQRRAWDSNPESLSDNGFKTVHFCATHPYARSTPSQQPSDIGLIVL
jgi:hypothetical protein